MIGTEHEYSINDDKFRPVPVSDKVIKKICGRYESEILFGKAKLGKELQKTVLEFVPREPADNPALLESQVMDGIDRFNTIFRGQYCLLGLGMHPLARVEDIPVWDHDEGEYYEVYDRLFNIRQHGWLNIQALQVNLSYRNDRDMVRLYNRLRPLLPYLIAVTASSPMVEGELTGSSDNRLLYYRSNQKEIPLICNNIIPEKIHSVADYRKTQEEIFDELRSRGAEILCEEWLNSSGLIIRFSRKCIEIKALDEQESVRSDMAVCAFIRALLRCTALPVAAGHDDLLSLTEDAIRKGTAAFRPELVRLYERAWAHAMPEEKRYLPVVRCRIENGSLAELMRDRFGREQTMQPVLADMAAALAANRPYGI